MKATILNREFQHPRDGWYQIERKGRHPNRAAGVVQVIDDVAATSIVNRFNEGAAAGTLRHGSEMLIDHEHFSDQADKETVAYGWLTRLANREDGIYGQVRWTGTGQKAVDGGDYRFFSTEYAPGDCEGMKKEECRMQNAEGSRMLEVRPMRLDGLTLTNMNNNRGQRPITNRGNEHPTSNSQHPTSSGGRFEFRRGLAAAAGSGVNNRGPGAPITESKRMKSVATKLGLSADASEEAVLEQVSKLMNRATAAEDQVTPLTARVMALEAGNLVLLSEQLDADFATAGVTDGKIINRHKGLLSDPKHFKNREERVAFITELAPAKAGTTSQRKLMNRDTRPPEGGETEGRAESVKATRIMNRAAELRGQHKNLSLATAVTMAQGEAENGS